MTIGQSYYGNKHDNDFTGTDDDDTFYLQQGGEDTAYGGGGNDIFQMGRNLSAGDYLDGGDGFDKVTIHGDYSAGLTLGPTTFVNIERLHLAPAPGHDYNLTAVDDLVAAGETLRVDAGNVGQIGGDRKPPGDVETSGFVYDKVTFDASAETDGRYKFIGGLGDDHLIGGAGNDRFFGGMGSDTFDMTMGGDDRAYAGFGDISDSDDFVMGAALTANDVLQGGLFQLNDFAHLDGDYWGAHAVVFLPTTMTAIETIVCADGNSYDLTTADETVDSFSNLTLTVDATALADTYQTHIDGSAEADSNFRMWGGAGSDEFIGGAYADELEGNDGADILEGGGGLDTLTGGAGGDTFRYTAVSESASASFDTVTDFDASEDVFDTTVAVAGVIATPRTGSISFASFDSDMGNAISDTLLQSHAIRVQATGGDYINHEFLVIDANNNALYDGGVDYVIDITGFSGTIATGNFI